MYLDAKEYSFLMDADKGGSGASSTPADAAKGDAAPADQSASGKASDGKDVPFHEHPRWIEVLGDRNSIREVIGDMTPEDLKVAMRDLREFYRIVNEPDEAPVAKQEPPKPGTDEAKRAELRAGALKELEELSPGITQAYKRLDSQFQALGRRADKATTKVMKDNGYTEKDREWLSKSIIEVMNSKGNEDIWDLYITGAVDIAIAEAWDVISKKLRTKQDSDARADKLRAAKTTQSLPRTHRPGGSADTLTGKPAERPTNIKDAGKSALAKLEAMD